MSFGWIILKVKGANYLSLGFYWRGCIVLSFDHELNSQKPGSGKTSLGYIDAGSSTFTPKEKIVFVHLVGSSEN